MNSLFGKDFRNNTLHKDCIFEGMMYLMYQNESECCVFVFQLPIVSNS